MKITILTRSYPTTGTGGLPNVCKNLCDELAKVGHEIVVLTMSNPHKPVDTETINNVRIEYLPCPALRYTDKWYKLATKRVGDIKPDIIYSESAAGHYVVDRYPDIPSVQRLHGFSYEEMISWIRPVIDNPRGDYLSARFINVIQDYILKVREDRVNAQKYSCLVGLTEVNARNIKYILQPRRTEMIYNGIDIGQFNYKTVKDKPYDIIFIGHLTRMKGVQLLDDAMSFVLNWNPEIKCVAFGADKENIKIRHIEKKGEISHDQLPDIYRQSKIFVNPSYHYTGMDTTIMEATCCGLPCIVTEGENLEEIIGRAAIYGFPRDNAEMLAQTIIALLNEVDNLDNEKISNAGKILFSRERMVKEHLKLFDSLIHK